MNEYTKQVVGHYTKYRDNYRSTDKIVFPLAKQVGIRNKTILDFGCGHGIDAMKFVRLGAKQVIGIDPSKAMIDLAKKENNHPKIKFIKTNGKNLTLKDNQFDLVFANFVVHYLKNTKQQFKEIGRVLKPGGYFLAVFNCLTNDNKLLNKRIPMVLGKGEQHTKIHIVSKSPQEIKTNLTDTGLTIRKFMRIANPDANISPDYKNMDNFKKMSYVFIAQKVK